MFTIHWDENDPNTVALEGVFDAATCDDIYAALRTVAPPNGGHLVVDLQGVTFIDSSGVRALLLLKEELEHQLTSLVVSRPSPEVDRIFEILALRSTLTLRASSPR